MKALISLILLATTVVAGPPSAQDLGLTQQQWYDWLSDHYGLYGFMPDKQANLAGVILFAILLLAHMSLGVYYRQWWFGVCVSCGVLLEFLGFLGRYLSAVLDIQAQSYYIMQSVCLTLAPAFIMAGVYAILAKLIVVYGESYSRLGPIVYTIIFVVGDWVSIIIQAAGGGIAATQSNTSGTWVMVAGIAFQVLVMSLFFLFYFEFLARVYWGKRNPDVVDSQANQPEMATIRASKKMPYFIGFQTVAIVLIYTRSIYRIIELSGGWHSHLILAEAYMLVLDGLMMVLAIMLLAVFHPGFMFGRVAMKANLHKRFIHQQKEEELSGSQNENENVGW